MLRKLVFWLILVPLAILILMFAVANREIVTVSFDPFNATAPAASVSDPVFVLIFVLVILGVIFGGVAAWLKQSGYRRVARQRDTDVTALHREIETLKARLDERFDDRFDSPGSKSAARLDYRSSANG
jgi:uncharacterized integral membrane protein